MLESSLESNKGVKFALSNQTWFTCSGAGGTWVHLKSGICKWADTITVLEPGVRFIIYRKSSSATGNNLAIIMPADMMSS